MTEAIPTVTIDRVPAVAARRGPGFARSLAMAGSIALLSSGILVASATGLDAQTSPARAWFADTYDRMEIEATGPELDRLDELWRQSADGGRPLDERRASLRELLATMLEIQDVPQWRYTDQNLASLANRVDEIVGSSAPTALAPSRVARWGEAGGIEVLGTGPVPLVLISDLDYGAEVYRDFSRRHAHRYTSYLVTLPGAAGTPAPPVGGRVSDTPWLTNAQRVVLDLLDRRDIADPVVVGVMGGVYPAARLALDHPERFRAAVLLHGLVNAPMLSPVDPSRLATLEERRAWAAGTLPPLLPTDSAATARSYRALASASAIDSATAVRLTESAMQTDPRVFARYLAELTVTDLTEDMGRLEVPTLVLPSIHDGRSPIPGTELGTGQWTSLKLDRPTIPMTVVPFPSTRNYAPVDRPDALANALDAFLNGQNVVPPHPDPALSGMAASPSSEVSRVLGATSVRVSYSAPGAKGRTIWGGLVPWDRLWRAGANAATRIDFSEDVRIEGSELDAGSYALFVTPRARGGLDARIQPGGHPTRKRLLRATARRSARRRTTRDRAAP